ncbi:hypothetical protein SAMN04488105_110233 [Salipiger thiooxidans]|uniref:SMODS and SLOG-associating 2TM effector domain-containing protein n=1 Tax=Salipiger thiooxidans TaxID=282683 RepID=A0A1G7HDI3_9RHOB|nr:hypothetical protein [Salipiger thiooxidans]SDE98416.1 hypothetical protein SAMN04488105_110233 [Salipiger thiooxidans]
MPANSDIGGNGGDGGYLRHQYPLIAESLIWPELVKSFNFHEHHAKEMKTTSRRHSFFAITCIVASLSVTWATTSSYFVKTLTDQPQLQVTLALASLLLLLAAIGLGKGILFGRRREQWLRHRLAAERLRQFYFQFLLKHRALICGGSEDDLQHLEAERAIALERVNKDVSALVYKQTVLNDTQLEEAALVERELLNAGEDLRRDRLDELRRFWREFRFSWQIEYATEQNMRQPSPLPIFGTIADQEHSVSTLEFVATLAIVSLHCLAVAGQLLGTQAAGVVSTAVLAASLFAIAIVGLQAYRDGVGLTEDLSRNRVYASYTSKLLRDLEHAQRNADLPAEIHIMYEMEDLAYFEMREFLQTHSEARFSL